MADFNNPNADFNQQSNQNNGDTVNQQPSYQQPYPPQDRYQQVNTPQGQQYQQPSYGGQAQYQQPQYQQPQYSGQSQYQQSQFGGQSQYKQPFNQQPKKTNGMAIGSLACGIASVLINCCMILGFLSIIVAIVGVVLGILVLKNNPDDKNGKTMSIVGIVLSGVGALIAILTMIGCFALAGNGDFWEGFYDGFNSTYYGY